MNASDPIHDDRERYDVYWRRVRAAPQAHDLFGTLRWIDALGARHARIGRAAHPREEPVRLGQLPSLSFAPAMIAQVTEEANDAAGAPVPRLLIHGFGLFGPNGPMPLYLTEDAHAASADAGNNALSRFADLFHHRLIALLYRAWADAQPVVARDHAQCGPFDRFVASFIGRAQRIERPHASALPLSAMCFHAGHWARHTRNPEGLVRMLSDDLGVDARLEEHVVHWMPIGEAQRTTLRATQSPLRLGHGAMLGRAVRDGQSCFRIVLGPLSLDRYRAFLPGAEAAARVAQWVREYVGVELGWMMQLELAAQHVPRYSLGAREGLGHSVWLGRRTDAAPARDLFVDWTAGSARARPQPWIRRSE